MDNHWNGRLGHAYGTSMTSVSMGKFVWSKLKDIPTWESGEL